MKKDANDYPLDFLKKKALNKEEFLQFCQKYQFDSIAKKIKNSKLSEQKSNETVKAETPKKSSSKKDMTPEMIASEIPPDKYANIYQSQYEVVDTIEGLDKWIEDIKSVGVSIIMKKLLIICSKLQFLHSFQYQRNMIMSYVEFLSLLLLKKHVLFH